MPYVDYDAIESACSECGRYFHSEEALEAHRVEAHASSQEPSSKPKRRPTVPCSLCRMRFHSIAALGEHSRKVHSM
jgi:hypothetical protein